ncbi:hypothetical protein P5F04_08340 [Clostridium perfringens]|uniref:hypothetical protein n=1 Tax=Clostridium perfringens TaxID=1502 RepID=UPI002A25BAF7|nr:hypothetical protein [Clostridium perfringens]MDK0664777.1 hypothetical protein [Clostridium perfringens]
MILFNFNLANINIYEFTKDIIIPLLGSIGGVLSFYIAYKVYFKEYKPKISLDYDVKNDGKYNKLLVYKYLSEEEIFNAGPGFNKSWNDVYNVYLKIKNNSDQAITNFELEYELSLFKRKIKLHEDDPSEFEDQGLEEFRNIKQKIKMDYIPPHKEITELIFISSIIPVADISIVYAKSKEVKFFKKQFILYKFDILKELGGMNDAVHMKKLYGIM